MDKKQEKKLTVAIIILVVLLLIAIALPILFRLPSEYSYVGVNGVEYNFTIDKHTGKSIHILPFWVEYQTANDAPSFAKEYLVPFEYGPDDLNKISLDKSIKDLIFNKEKTKVIYITRNPYLGVESDGKTGVAVLTILRITGKEMDPAAFKIETIGAVTEAIEETEYNDIPVRTCEDGGKLGRTIILMERGEENRIYIDEENDQCVVLEFVSDDDSVAVATKLVYHLIGLI